MTNAFIRRFDAPTPQRIAPSPELLVGCSAPVLMQIVPTICNRFFRFISLRLHTSQASQDRTDFAQVESGHGRFHPL